jgi:hypothetical protein
MLQAIIGGESDPQKLADMAKLRLREKIPQAAAGAGGPDHPASWWAAGFVVGPTPVVRSIPGANWMSACSN